VNQAFRALQAVAVTLWVGSLWTMGLLIAPMLFRILPDRVLAGAVAGRLFSVVAYLGFACAACLIVLVFAGSQREAKRFLLWLVMAMAALTAIGEFGIQPILAELKEAANPLDVMQSELRGQFATWHGIASGLYLLNCGLGGVLVVLHNRAVGPRG
jgi:hypothetical protein